jgi:hypothetical protein
MIRGAARANEERGPIFLPLTKCTSGRLPQGETGRARIVVCA